MTEAVALKVYLPVHVARPNEIPARVGAVARAARASTIGIVDDNLDPPFMEALVAGLRERFPDTEVRVWIKPVGTAPAPESLIEEMAEEVQIALSGIGL